MLHERLTRVRKLEDSRFIDIKIWKERMLQIRGNTYRKLNTSPGDEDISRLCEHNFLPVRGFGQRKYSSKQSIGFTVTLICRLSCYRVCPGFSNARSENFAESVCFFSLSSSLSRVAYLLDPRIFATPSQAHVI